MCDSSDDDWDPITYRLKPNKTYEIIDVTTNNTYYGHGYLLWTDKYTNYYSNKKITAFLDKHPNIKKFTLKTLDLKEFTVNNKKIKYFDVKIENIQQN